MARMAALLAAPLQLRPWGSTEAMGPGPGPAAAAVCLAPPRPVGSALLLRRPWGLLLRLLLQLGVSQGALLCCGSLAGRPGAAAAGRRRHNQQEGSGGGGVQGEPAAAAGLEGKQQGQGRPQCASDAEAEAEAAEVQQELLDVMPPAVHGVRGWCCCCARGAVWAIACCVA